jgi:serine/threonine-protein kinase
VAAPKLIDLDHDGPQRIDRYELVAEIASGGMATVYLASLSGVGGFRRFVAIKRLHPHLAKEQEFVEMFLDEARLAAGIHHPHVVPILEVGASERGYYLVMEYIEGDTLARLLARATTAGNRLPAAIGTRIVVEMLSGLHAAHELRDEHGEPTELVHRDVSPQNILVGIDGTTRITDFGVARAASRLSATRAGQLKGKIAYMAPEQAVGDPSVDRRADVFSAGIVLWEVLAARRLFKAENEAATLSRVISEPIPHVREINPDVDPRVAGVVMHALERDRDLRYDDCQQFADDLERCALAAGLIASSREVSTYVGSVIGQEIAQQRDAVRAWLARSEPSQAIVPESANGSHQSMPPPHGTARVAAAEHSGMVASRGGPFSAPPLEMGLGRSKAPLLVVAAAVIGFGIVAFLLTTGGSPQDHSITQAPASGAQAPAAPIEPKPALGRTEENPAAAVTTTTEAPHAAPEPGASKAEPTPSNSADKAAVPPGPARFPVASGHVVPRQSTRSRGNPTSSESAKPASATPPAPSRPSDPDLDLSNPYR